MQLFYLPVSPYSHKVLWVTHDNNLDIATEVVNPFIPEQKAAHQARYPLGKLPLLKDGNKLIPESSIIVEYLDSKAKTPSLVPSHPEDAREVRGKDRLADCYLTEPSINLLFQSLRPKETQDQERIAKSLSTISAAYTVVEQTLRDNDSLCFHRDTFSLADIALIFALRVSQKAVAFDQHPYIYHYYKHYSDYEAFKSIDQEASQAMEAFLAARANQS